MTGGASTHLTRSNYRGGPPLSQIGNRPVEEFLRTRTAAAQKPTPNVNADPISSSDEGDNDEPQQHIPTPLVKPKRQRVCYGESLLVGRPGRYGYNSVNRRAAESKDRVELSSSESSLKSEATGHRSPKRSR